MPTRKLPLRFLAGVALHRLADRLMPEQTISDELRLLGLALDGIDDAIQRQDGTATHRHLDMASEAAEQIGLALYG